MPHTVFDARIGTVSSAAYYVRQIASCSIGENLSVIEGRQSGAVAASDYFIDAGNPSGEITTTDISRFLTAFGTLGGKIADGTTVILPFRTRVSGGSHASGSSHSTVSGATSSSPVQILPGSVSAGRNGPATASGSIYFLSEDGIESPILVNFNDQSLVSQAFTGMYRLGPVFLNGTQIPKQVGFNVNFGVRMSQLLTYDGGVYPVDCYIEEASPTVSVSQEDFDAINRYLGGVTISAGSFYLQKMASGSTVVDPADAEHIKFSFASGIAVGGNFGATGQQHGSGSVTFHGAALTVNTATAITT